jgi:hypothetical protein
VEQETYIWELMLELGRGLFLDLAWDFGVGGVGDALAVFVLHFDGGWGVCFGNGQKRWRCDMVIVMKEAQ